MIQKNWSGNNSMTPIERKASWICQSNFLFSLEKWLNCVKDMCALVALLSIPSMEGISNFQEKQRCDVTLFIISEYGTTCAFNKYDRWLLVPKGIIVIFCSHLNLFETFSWIVIITTLRLSCYTCVLQLQVLDVNYEASFYMSLMSLIKKLL